MSVRICLPGRSDYLLVAPVAYQMIAFARTLPQAPGMKVRLATNRDEVRAAQGLRFHVFHAEMGANLDPGTGLDCDLFDEVSEHLLVIEPGFGSHCEFPVADGNLVGTCRLITAAKANDIGGFYSGLEFDLAPLLQRHSKLNFLELGRSCILKRARGMAVVELLWHGIWDFARQNKIDVMFGCASFEGVDPLKHRVALSFIAQHPQCPAEWRVRALPRHYREMDTVPVGSYDPKLAFAAMPPLVKGYLRLGCIFGEGCVIDQAFNTVDVLIVLPVFSINPRFFARFGKPA